MTPALRIGLLALFTLWLLAAQVRYSLEQWEAKSAFHFAPFSLVPFSNVIQSRTEWARPREVVSVNGRRLTGHSVYWQAVRHRTGAFDIRVKTKGREEQLEVHSAHCTCGRMSDEWIARYLVLPPAVALLVGLVVAWRRPREPAGWLFLLLMASVGQVELFGLALSSFPQDFNPMTWTDAFRVPYLAWSAFAAAAWPAWLVLLLCGFHQPAWLGRARGLAAPILLVALLKAALAVGLSENVLAVAPLHNVLVATETARMLAMLTAVVVTLLPLIQGLWRVVLVVPVVAALLLYWPAPEIPKLELVNYVSGPRLEPLMPAFHRTPELILGGATLGLVMFWFVAAGAGRLDWAILVTWTLPAVFYLRHLGGWWWWLGEGTLETALAIAGVGVLLTLVRFHRRGSGPIAA